MEKIERVSGAVVPCTHAFRAEDAIEKGPFTGTSFHSGRNEIFIIEKAVKGGVPCIWPGKMKKKEKNQNYAHAYFVEYTMLK